MQNRVDRLVTRQLTGKYIESLGVDRVDRVDRKNNRYIYTDKFINNNNNQ